MTPRDFKIAMAEDFGSPRAITSAMARSTFAPTSVATARSTLHRLAFTCCHCYLVMSPRGTCKIEKLRSEFCSSANAPATPHPGVRKIHKPADNSHKLANSLDYFGIGDFGPDRSIPN